MALPVAALVVVAGLALLAGCTSESPDQVGAGLVDVSFDGLADTLTSETVTDFGEVAVSEQRIQYADLQLLYVGRQGTIRSELLASYDFARFNELADSLGAAVVDSNIVEAKLYLYGIKYYRDFKLPDGSVINKDYVLRELAAPLDTTQFPGPAPALAPGFLSSTPGAAPAVPTVLEIPPTRIVAWSQDPASFLGLDVGENEADSDPGLVGFAGRYFPYPKTQIQDTTLVEGTQVGPVIHVQFKHPPNTFINLQPKVNLSTLTGLGPVPQTPAEGILLRTHVRVYPRLRFDTSALPPNVLVNRALLVLTPDTNRCFGPPLEVVAVEADSAAVAGNAVLLEDLGPASRVISGLFSVDPDTLPARLRLDVTSMVQRQVNGAIEKPIELMLTAGEDFTGIYDTSKTIDPEFFLSRLFFYGTEAADPQARPRLQVVYSKVSEIVQGGQR